MPSFVTISHFPLYQSREIYNFFPVSFLSVSTTASRHKNVPQKDSPSTYVKPIAKSRRYAVSRFKIFLEGYETILKKFPVAYRLHQVFLIGKQSHCVI